MATKEFVVVRLKSMNVSDLLKLRADVDKELKSRRRELEREFAQLGGSIPTKAGLHKGGKVPARYRHPETGQEWSGRGVIANWLAAEIKAGKSKESFLIKT